MDDEVDPATIVSKIQDLSDLELATLLCFVADQHCCIVQADEDQLDRVGRELELISRRTFALPCVNLPCSSQTTLDNFGNGILLSVEDLEITDYLNPDGRSRYGTDPRERIAPVIIASRLNEADQEVQIQALELIRSKRTSPHNNFLLIALTARGTKRLTPHLNDQIFISHTHDPLDPLIYIATPQISTDSLSSIIRSPPLTPNNLTTPKINPKDIQTLRALTEKVSLDTDVRAYIHDLTTYLRTNRFVAGGISALATLHFHLLCRVLAPLHGLTFIIPSLVDLAARKIYVHRIILATPESERSRMWGSSMAAVGEILDGGVTAEGVVDMVVEAVGTPL